ncbi:hypothetical protein ASPZODRAFT_137296, partial [Penicilliopsis zonata CBS 506.65]
MNITPVVMPFPSSSPAAVPPRRRRKTRLACISCRIRKTGCDGGRPACGTCVVRGRPDQCVYQADARPRVPAASQPESVTRFVYTAHMRRSPSPSRTKSLGNPTPPYTESLVDPDLVHLNRSSSVAVSNGNSSTTHAPSFDDEGAIFGPSSNHAFIRRVAAAASVASEDDIRQQSNALFGAEEQFINDSVGFPVVDESGFSYDYESVTLPPRPLSDVLVRAYWRHVHPLLPILHQPSVSQTYMDLWQPSAFDPKLRRKRIYFHAVLNMMFALGCQRYDGIPPEQRKQDAATFYKRSLRLASVETLDVYSLVTVQLLLLRTLYLQYAPHSVRCWTTCGVAIRAAQGLALHLDRREENQIQRETRRKLWYGALILERFAATSSGWPVTPLVPNPVPFPAEIDDEYLLESGEGRQPENIPSRVSFFNQYAKLTVSICTEILEKVYSYVDEKSDGNPHLTCYHYLRDVPEMCSRLDDFVENLPPHLKQQNFSSGNRELDECFHTQGEILRQRAVYIRLLVLRPCLLTSVKLHMREMGVSTGRNEDSSSVASLLRGSTMRDLSLLGVSTAHIVLDDLHLTRQLPTWHTVRMAYGAMIVLLAASLIPELLVDFKRGPGKLSWNKTLDILEQYKLQDATVENGIKTLWRYHNEFKAWRDKGTGSTTGALETTVTEVNESASLENVMPVLDENWLANMAKEFEKDFPLGELEHELFDSSMPTGWAIP